MLEQRRDDPLLGLVPRGVEPELLEPLVVAYERGGLVGDRGEDALEVGSCRMLLQIFDDVELDAAALEDLDDAACLTQPGLK